MTNEQAEKMLRNIELTGSVDRTGEIDIVLGSRVNLNHIAGITSGSMKIYPSVTKKFDLIISKPETLKALEWHDIRCCFCGKIISYPCWYYSIRYAVNVFHYFVCFDGSSPSVVNCKCYRRIK